MNDFFSYNICLKIYKILDWTWHYLYDVIAFDWPDDPARK